MKVLCSVAAAGGYAFILVESKGMLVSIFAAAAANPLGACAPVHRIDGSQLSLDRRNASFN
jgi:hypothetical protein